MWGFLWVVLLLLEMIPNTINWSVVSKNWGRWLWIPWALLMLGQLVHILRVSVAGMIYGEAEMSFFQVSENTILRFFATC